MKKGADCLNIHSYNYNVSSEMRQKAKKLAEWIDYS